MTNFWILCQGEVEVTWKFWIEFLERQYLDALEEHMMKTVVRMFAFDKVFLNNLYGFIVSLINASNL